MTDTTGVQCDTYSPMAAKKRQRHSLMDRYAPYEIDVDLDSVGQDWLF